MLSFIDNLLNRVTMYRLLLYALMAFITAAVILAFLGLIPYSPLSIIYSNIILYVVCYGTNYIFSKIFKVPTNAESSALTAMILTLIITPGAGWIFLASAGAISQASKYLLNFRGKHLFNPAAIAVVATMILLGEGASWWVGNMYLLPFVIIGGFLAVRKIQRFDLVFSFLAAYFTALFFATETISLQILRIALVNSAIMYFALIMLTEPSTTPPKRYLRIIYGALVGALFGSGLNFGPIYASPELALVLGNIFSFAVGDKTRYKMTLKEKKEIAPQTFSFVFEPNRRLNHEAGQYLEWTVDVKKPDARGNRRYFTVASSPTEEHVNLGIKFYENPSAFKKSLMNLKIGDKIFAGELAGDFILPRDLSRKLAFIAGGIGITPFRSIVKYLVDKQEKRDIVLFYAANSDSEFAYRDILQKGEQAGVKIVYKTDRLTAQVLKKELPDFLDRTFYISGPRGMVDAFKKSLTEMGVPSRQIKIDFFPGYV